MAVSPIKLLKAVAVAAAFAFVSAAVAGLSHGVAANPALAEEPAVAPEQSSEAAVDEPDGYRTDGYRTPVPKTLKGAKVIATVEAEALHAAGAAAFIDVYPRAPKPPNLPPNTLWRDPPHATVPGAVWLPNVGYGVLPPEAEAVFKTQLEKVSGGNKSKPMIFYCLRNCWMSWNAAKRAVSYGYSGVIWYPDGNDGWQEAGNDLANVKPLE